MFSDIDPMAITLVIVAVALVGSVIGVARRGRSAPAPRHAALPAGADAALWSITEVLPDPRNHLAIKDPTSELRLTARERAAAAEAAAPVVRPADAARSAQSIAARRAALAKRAPAASAEPAPATESAPSAPVDPHVVAAAPSTIELVQPTLRDEPLVIFLEDHDAVDPRHLILLPEDLVDPASVPATAAGAPTTPRWGESPARAS